MEYKSKSRTKTVVNPDAYEYEEGINPTLSPFTRLLNFIKSLLTTKTGNAILNGKITGNAIGNGDKNIDYEKPLIVFAIGVIVIVLVMVVIKIKKNEKIKKRKKKIK